MTVTNVQPLMLLASSSATWTTTQEKAIARDYPFVDLDSETADQFVVRTYLQFLWLPESIMSIHLLIPSLHRVQDASPRPPDTPHPLHALLDPLLLSVRSVATKYHTELPQILAQDGGDGETEESMMWYALGYEMMGETDDDGAVHTEDAIMVEEKARRAWLERLERREVQIQVLLYLLKLSLPGPCAPLPPVTVPTKDLVPSGKKRKKERAKVVVPSPEERLESFMDKLCTWQLVINMNDESKPKTKDERDWMQTFCEDVVERQFKSQLPNMCTLLRSKLFPHSPFSDEDDSTDTSASGSKLPGPARSSRKLARSSTSTSTSTAQSKGGSNPKPLQRSPSVQSHTTTSDLRSRSRSLSVSLAQDASARRTNAASGTSSSLKRALSREVSMSRGFKPRVHSLQSQAEASTKAPPKVKKDTQTKKEDKRAQGVTLVAATPVKPKARGYGRVSSQSQSQSRIQAPSFDLDMRIQDEDDFGDDAGDADGDDDFPDVPKDEDDEQWLPDSSPDVLLLSTRKRSASGSSSSMGLSDPTEAGLDTPVKKRIRI